MQGPPRVACPHGIPQPCLHNPLSPTGPQPLHTAPTPSLWQSPHGRTPHPHQRPHGRTPSQWAPPMLLLHQQGLVIPLQGCLRPRLLSPAIRGVPMSCCQIPCLEAYRQASITTASMWTRHNPSIPSCISLVPSNDGNNQKCSHDLVCDSTSFCLCRDELCVVLQPLCTDLLQQLGSASRQCDHAGALFWC